MGAAIRLNGRDKLRPLQFNASAWPSKLLLAGRSRCRLAVATVSRPPKRGAPTKAHVAQRSPVPRAAAGRVLLRGPRLEAAAAPERAGRQLPGGPLSPILQPIRRGFENCDWRKRSRIERREAPQPRQHLTSCPRKAPRPDSPVAPKKKKAPPFLTGLPRLQSQCIGETDASTDVIGPSDFQRSSFRASDQPWPRRIASALRPIHEGPHARPR